MAGLVGSHQVPTSNSMSFRNRRLVLFAGPHKSASSSVQQLFMELASSETHPHHPSLVNWTWPWLPRWRSYLPRKALAPLVTEPFYFHKFVHDEILYLWNTYDSHLVLGTEELDRFGMTPWSNRDGMKAISDLHSLLKPEKMEIVVNYRRPRNDHWISIWKQLSRSDGRTYADFLCDSEDYLRIWEYLDCVANPLGLVLALLENGWQVHLLDMRGIAQLGRDVAHTMACDVLMVPCGQDHWLPGVNYTIQQNAKSGNPQLGERQVEAMDRALRQRDCSYRDVMERYQLSGRLTVHHGSTLWDQCELDFNPLLSNTTVLLDVLQEQVGCEPFDKFAILHQRQVTRQWQVPLQPGQLREGQLVEGESMRRTLTAQLVVLYAMLAMLMYSLLPRFKHKGAAQQRFAGRGYV